ncbi:MAG: hypothetical protein HQ478_16010 [Chloroflexi bacterium]|nr:hypothetical protein [Chloroflexota bacterium]
MPIFSRNQEPVDDWMVIQTILHAESQLHGQSQITPSRRAGILFRPDENNGFLTTLERELIHILNEGEGATKTASRIEDDDHGTRWVVLDDGNFEDLVSSVYTIGNAMTHNDAAQLRIAAVFEFYRSGSSSGEDDWAPGSVGYWVYRYDRQRFYPFVPEGDEERNRPAETQISQMMRSANISVEKEVEEWRPIWGIPF